MGTGYAAWQKPASQEKRAIEMIYNGLAVYRNVGVMRMVVVDVRDVERCRRPVGSSRACATTALSYSQS